MSRLSSAVLSAIAALSCLSLACASKNSGSTSSQDTSGAEDVNGTESDTESLGSSLVGGDGQSMATQADLAAQGDIRAMGGSTTGNPGYFFQPAGCVQATVDKVKMTASYVFTNCTGPLGLVTLNGTVNATWSVAGGKLTINYSASGFKMNRATIDSWTATAVLTPSGSNRDLTWNAKLSGTTGSGRSFTRTNSKDLKWTVGQPCLEVSGTSDGTITGSELKTTITSFKRCADSCPEAGSEINVQNVTNGDSIDVKFSGGDSATLTVNGKTSTITLACGQ